MHAICENGNRQEDFSKKTINSYTVYTNGKKKKSLLPESCFANFYNLYHCVSMFKISGYLLTTYCVPHFGDVRVSKPVQAAVLAVYLPVRGGGRGNE